MQIKEIYQKIKDYISSYIKPLELVEIFTEHKVIMKGGSQYGRYNADYIIEKRPNAPKLVETDLILHVGKLNSKYPEEKFYIDKIKWKGKILHVLTKRKNSKDKPRVPIYFDLENQKFFINKRDLEKDERLTNYIIMRTLGALKISQSRYANGIKRGI